MNLRHLTDKTLLADTKRLVEKERSLSIQILHHLKEIERRRLFSDLGYGSLFEYTVKELGYSEASASRRIQSARLLKEIPTIENKLKTGELSITNVALAALTFKNENVSDKETKIEILSKIENKTKRECEKALNELLPTSKKVALSFKIEFSEKNMELLEEIKGLLAHRRMKEEEIFFYVLSLSIEEIKKQKFKLNAKFNTPVAKPCITRSIPNIIKKQVYERDQGRCVKCKSSYKLEYDHMTPFAHGGKTSLENLRLLCFSCNQRRLKT